MPPVGLVLLIVGNNSLATFQRHLKLRFSLYLEIHSVDQSILTEDDLSLTGKLAEKVKGISDILQRNSMKVVFFGR